MIVTLHKYTAKTYREIAALVGLSVATVSRGSVIKLNQDAGSVFPKRKGKCSRKKKPLRETMVTYSNEVKKIHANRATI